jgi:hypothetical protein
MSISREPVSDASPMIRIMLVIALVWLASMPPFFTDGACTAEFNKVDYGIAQTHR